MRAKGRRALQGGVYNGVTFAYLSTDEDLGVVTEIFDWPPGRVQEPDAVIPDGSLGRLSQALVVQCLIGSS